MKTISTAIVASLGWAAILHVATCPAMPAQTPPASTRAPVVLRVNRSGSTGLTAHAALAKTQVPANVLIADADAKDVSVPAGAAQAHLAFELVNISAAAVTINSVQTSCGCTIAELATLPLKLAPGASAPVTITMNVAGKSGVVAKTATVVTDKGMKTLLARVTILPAAAGSRATDPPHAAPVH